MSFSLLFLHPFLLIALILLPIFWWILSALPPQPVLRSFPPLKLLLDLQDKTASPKSIPLWLRLLRLFMITSIIIALAGPILVPANESKSDKPILLVIDDGWASAQNWPKIKAGILAHLARAEVNGQQIAMVFSTETSVKNPSIEFVPIVQLRQQISSKQPQPFAPDHQQTAQRLKQTSAQNFTNEKLQIIWFSDGYDYGYADGLLDQLQAMGELQILQASGKMALRITSLQSKTNGVEVNLSRQSANSEISANLLAQDRAGNVLANQAFTMAKDQTHAQISINLPLELRNRMGAVRIKGIASAAAVHLLDQSWAKPRVGILGARSKTSDQPLLSQRFYLEKALRPFAEISDIDLNNDDIPLPPIVILLDTGKLSQSALSKLSQYVQNGGFLIRFAGPFLAEHQDDLIPVPLRTGGRLLGSALGWDQPQQLAAFSDTSPFFGLDSTAPINVKRQVLAQGSAGLSAHVWARLTDGTPLVTSAQRGDGRLVLFHVSASANWSELPLSGTFVQMLKRLLPMATRPNMSSTSGEELTAELQLSMALQANGQLRIPDGSQKILTLGQDTGPVNRDFPPGLWSNPKISLARNVLDNQVVKPFPPVPTSVKLGDLQTTKPVRLEGFLLVVALILLIVDSLAILALAGKLPRLQKPDTYKLVLGFVLFGFAASLQPPPALSAELDPFEVIKQTRLAFVITNNPEVDRFSRAGLTGLSRELYLRTTVEPAEPVGIELEHDDLTVVSFLYWPLIEPAKLSDQAAAKINTYLKNGGMLVIDTQDGGLRAASAGGVDPALGLLSSQIHIPSVIKIPKDHVLTRSYYLIQSFPGRYSDTPLWVEGERKGSSLDGVSSMVIGANDWAAAWAINEDGQPLAAVSGRTDNQRELARRFGINLVMYVLAGNYKADQVHIPALLERLNQ